MLRELETVCNKVIRLENTTLEALKKENEVRCSMFRFFKFCVYSY